ncbi:hypothetical protein ACEPAI_2788 [Sanghuangporus weigelae]
MTAQPTDPKACERAPTSSVSRIQCRCRRRRAWGSLDSAGLRASRKFSMGEQYYRPGFGDASTCISPGDRDEASFNPSERHEPPSRTPSTSFRSSFINVSSLNDDSEDYDDASSEGTARHCVGHDQYDNDCDVRSVITSLSTLSTTSTLEGGGVLDRYFFQPTRRFIGRKLTSRHTDWRSTRVDRSQNNHYSDALGTRKSGSDDSRSGTDGDASTIIGVACTPRLHINGPSVVARAAATIQSICITDIRKFLGHAEYLVTVPIFWHKFGTMRYRFSCSLSALLYAWGGQDVEDYRKEQISDECRIIAKALRSPQLNTQVAAFLCASELITVLPRLRPYFYLPENRSHLHRIMNLLPAQDKLYSSSPSHVHISRNDPRQRNLLHALTDIAHASVAFRSQSLGWEVEEENSIDEQLRQLSTILPTDAIIPTNMPTCRPYLLSFIADALESPSLIYETENARILNFLQQLLRINDIFLFRDNVFSRSDPVYLFWQRLKEVTSSNRRNRFYSHALCISLLGCLRFAWQSLTFMSEKEGGRLELEGDFADVRDFVDLTFFMAIRLTWEVDPMSTMFPVLRYVTWEPEVLSLVLSKFPLPPHYNSARAIWLERRRKAVLHCSDGWVGEQKKRLLANILDKMEDRTRYDPVL